MDRILLQPVGVGGEGGKWPVHEAIAKALRQRTPSLVLFICSSESEKKTLPKVEEELGGLPPSERLIIPDANDLDSIVTSVNRRVTELVRAHPQGKLEVDITSGTKPMTAAVALVGALHQATAMHYAVGPREEGRAIRTEKILSIDVANIRALVALPTLSKLYGSCQWTAVQTLVNNLQPESVTDQSVRAKLESIRYMASVCDHWDRFRWHEAFAELRKYTKTRSLESAGWNLEDLSRRVGFLKRCEDSEILPERLADLLANAERCHQTGRYDDCVCRCYRLFELCLQSRLRRFAESRGWNLKVNNPAAKVPLDLLNLAPEFKESILKRKVPSEAQKLDLGLRDLIEFLGEVEDPIGRWLKPEYERPGSELKEGLKARNDSYLAHGSRPIDETTSESLLKLGRELVRRMLEGEAPGSLEELSALACFPCCPW